MWLKRLVLAVICWVPVIIGRDAVVRAAGLVDLATAPNPYFVPSHALLLYVWTPLMTPGLILTWSSRRDGTSVWIMRGFLITIPLVSVVASLSQAMLGTAITGDRFLVLLAGLSVAALVRWRRLRESPGSQADPGYLTLAIDPLDLRPSNLPLTFDL